MNAKLEAYTKKYMKKHLPQFDIGDTVDVVSKILEGDKERKQTFQGTVIAIHGAGINIMFTVRRIVQGEGVERVFPLHSPRLVTVRVVRKGKVRRAKLYYLRGRVGKATKVKEKIWKLSEAQEAAASADGAAQEVLAMDQNKPQAKDGKGKKENAGKK
jgi:large subunit ribosomal protein L19